MFESTRIGSVLVAAGVLAAHSITGCSDESSGGGDDLSLERGGPAAAGASAAGGVGASPADGGGALDSEVDAGLDGAGGASNAAPGASAAAGSAALPPAPCTGCVELVAPVRGANSAENLQDQVGYQFNAPAPGLDFRSGRITWRLMALVNDDDLFVTLYAQNGAPDYSSVYPSGQALTSVNFPPGTWVDVILDLSAYGFVPGANGADAPGAAALDPGTFDKTRVESFGIQLRAGSVSTATRAIRVAVDSVTIEGVPGQFIRSFDTGTDGLAVNQYQVPLGTQPPLPH